MAYSKACKEEVLARFHASGFSVSEACRIHPEFPGAATLRKWIRLERAGMLEPAELEIRGRCEGRAPNRPYPTETKLEAVRLLRMGWEPRRVARRLGVSDPRLVARWGRRAAESGSPSSRPSDAERGEAVARLAQGEPAVEVAEGLGVHVRTVYRWAQEAGAGGSRPAGRTRRKAEEALDASGGESPGEQGGWARAWGGLPEDPEERARVAEVRLAEALAVLDVLKAPGPGSLSNQEKRRAGEAARAMTGRARLSDVLEDFSIPKSTYLSQAALAARPDKHAALRRRIRHEFEEAKGRYGSEPIWARLRQGEGAPVKARDLALGDVETPVVVSEKVVRRIMAEENLVPAQLRSGRDRYDSYEGEVDERPGNLPLQEDGSHDFRSDAPGRLLVTDVTEFKLPGFKVYLSPLVDCFDGMPVAWRISTRPDDDLTAGMLGDALPSLAPGAAVHTDGGGNYRSRRWKALCEEHGIVRSMSRKATSPDNARAEGFFGTLKQEFFYARDWTGVGRKKFVSLLEEYIVWYRDCKIKKSLGWKTLKEHRASMDEAA